MRIMLLPRLEQPCAEPSTRVLRSKVSLLPAGLHAIVLEAKAMCAVRQIACRPDRDVKFSVGLSTGACSYHQAFG